MMVRGFGVVPVGIMQLFSLFGLIQHPLTIPRSENRHQHSGFGRIFSFGDSR